MEFVKSVSEQRTLRSNLVVFYRENQKREHQHFCEYDLERVYLFITLKRSTLLFDIFDILVDYLVSIVRTKIKKKCFDHLDHHNCFHYFPQSHITEKILSLTKFFIKYNFNLTEVFRILSVCKKHNAYIIHFCCGSTTYRTSLPKSSLKTIAKGIGENPLFFQYYAREVYFRIDYLRLDRLGRETANIVVKMEYSHHLALKT